MANKVLFVLAGLSTLIIFFIICYIIKYQDDYNAKFFKQFEDLSFPKLPRRIFLAFIAMVGIYSSFQIMMFPFDIVERKWALISIYLLAITG